MSVRFSLRQRFLPVSRDMFVDYCTHFQKAVEREFGSPCALTITGYSRPKDVVTFLDENLQDRCRVRNEAARLFGVQDSGHVTRPMWREAKYVEVSLIPAPKEGLASSAFAHADFKGHLRRTATFYLQGADGADVAGAMAQCYPLAIKGDGCADHDNKNGMFQGRYGVLAMLNR